MLNLELKNLFINLKNGDWNAIGEHINSDWGDIDEENDNEDIQVLDKIILYLNICLPNGKNTEESIEIKFKKTEEEFLKEFQYLNENFPTYEYEDKMDEKGKYNIPEYDYITNCLKEKINKSYEKLKEKGYIAT